MKIKIILVILLLILVKYSYAQYNSIRIGILPFCDIDNKNKKLDFPVSELIAVFSKYKFIKIIERSRLNSIIQEIEFGMTGMVDKTTIAKAGKVKGLQAIVVGTLRKNKIAARVIHITTGRIISSYSIDSKSKLNNLGKKIASDIETFLTKENLKTLKNNSPVINLDFWIERKNKDKIVNSRKNNIMKIGESVIFYFKSNKHGYLTIVDIQPSGDVVILFPNDTSPDNRIIKNKIYSIPSSEDVFEIKVCKPTGIDTVVAFFTRKKVDWLDRKKLSGKGFWTVKRNQKIAMTRGFKVIATKLKSSDWESKVLEINVIK